MKTLKYSIWFALVFASFIFVAPIVSAQTTEFTYQGRLSNSTGTALNGNYDFEFKLYDSLTNGTQLGTTQQKLGVAVNNGIFTVNLDFGSQFGGNARYLEIAVRSGTNPFTILTPRQPITSAPYGIRSLTAGSASDSSRLGGVTASNYVQTTDARLSDSRTPTAGSGNYVQNRTTLQPGTTNFNIGGTGTANVFDAASQFNIAGSRILSVAGWVNIFAGVNAGGSNLAANSGNAIFGAGAGASNAGDSNTFLGSFAGGVNTTGSSNTLVGSFADVGAGNLDHATAIGADAVVSNSNSVVLGRNLDTVRVPGNLNVTGTLTASGSSLTNLNASNITSGTLSNSRLGVVGAANGGTGLTSAGAAGSFLRSNGSAWTSSQIQSSDVPSGSAFYVQNSAAQQSASFNISGSGTVGSTLTANIINTPNPYRINNSVVLSTSGTNNLFVGDGAGASNTGTNNTFVGENAGGANTTGSNNTVIGANANFPGSTPYTFSTVIGAGATAFGSNKIALGRISGDDRVVIPGELQLGTLGTGGDTPLCRNSDVLVSLCSSSLRYKNNIAYFNSGLNLLKQLQPITFDWKSSGKRDLGLGAEDVAKVEPLLVTYNEKGEVEGVKYDRIGVVLLNAVKEQQAEIEQLREQVRILKKLACAAQPQSEICREEK